MQYSYSLTILTPTYNRGSFLHVLYDSLCNQTCKDFQWLIIDDGSTDNTRDIVGGFNSEDFLVEYYYKANGGKHTALNYAHPYIKGEAVCIVDSDDWLIPNAVQIILKYKNKYFSHNNVKSLVFLRGKENGEAINTAFPDKPIISNHIDFRVNGHRGGDCCEVIDTDVLKEFPFPEHHGEKFLGEGYLWNNAGFKYDTAYIPEIIYVCEYLEEGLTKSGRRLRISCPLGGMDNSNSFFGSHNGRRVDDRTLIKESILFVCYGKFAGYNYNKIVRKAINKTYIKSSYILGCLLYKYWKAKYLSKS